MSEDTPLSRQQSYITAVKSMKSDIDVLYTQLRNGAYSSPDTFANNWAHLMRVVNEMKPLLSEPGVTERLLHTDVLLLADLLALVNSIEIIENFLACLERQAREENSKPP
ncbi:hypothetical protein P4910_18490 [Pantoea stewartii]|uniref:hypothetical protein n=1 Tax=Pantoea stewartii TaxID=66269 RepID=UPI0023F6EC39|nr:hypothetical protein [Pantoea stewartii]MDF7787451.1 hypothetical protein [Pantoea stewartii]